MACDFKVNGKNVPEDEFKKSLLDEFLDNEGNLKKDYAQKIFNQVKLSDNLKQKANAIQKPSAESLHGSAQTTTTSEGGEPERVGTSKQGEEITSESNAKEGVTAKEQEALNKKAKAESILGSEPFSAAKDVVNAKRKEIGLNPIMQRISSTDPELVAQASDIVANNGVEAIVENAIKKGRYTLNDAEQVALAYEVDALTDAYKDISDKYEAAKSKGEDTSALEMQKAAASIKMDMYSQVLRDAGTTSAKALRARQLFIDRQFEKSVIIQRMKAQSKNGEVPKQLQDEVEQLTRDRDKNLKALKDAEAEIQRVKEENKALHEKRVVEAAVNEISPKRGGGRRGGNVTDTTKKWATEVRKLKSKKYVFIDENGIEHDLTANGVTWNNTVETIAKLIESGGEVAQKIVELAEKLPIYSKLSKNDQDKLVKQLTEDANALREKGSFEGLARQVAEITGEEFDYENKSLLSPLNAMFGEKVGEEVAKGIKAEDIKYNDITKEIHDELSKYIPNIDITRLRDFISGYGEFRELNPDKTIRAIAELKNQMRLDAKVEATQRGELPLRNGFERSLTSPSTRTKNAEILKNIKEKGLEPPLSSEDIARAYASAEASHHRRLENAIADINKELAENKRKPRTKSNREFLDQRSKELEADLKLLKEQRDLKLPKESLSTEQKANLIAKNLENSIDEINKSIENLRNGKLEDGTPITVRSKEGNKIFGIGKDKAEKVTTDRIEELRKLKEGLQQEVSDLLPESIKDLAILDKLKEQRAKKLAALEAKIEKSKTDKTVFEPKRRVKYEAKSTDAKVLATQKVIEKHELAIKEAERKLENLEDDWKYANMGNWEAFGYTLNAYSREGAISNPLAIPKIFSSGALSQVFKPYENIIGALSIHTLPKNVREMASMEGKLSPKIEVKSLAKLFSGESWTEAWEGLKTGSHREDKLYGEKKIREIEIPITINGVKYKFAPLFSGRLHKFAKTVPYKAALKRNYEYALQDAVTNHPEYFENGALRPEIKKKLESEAFMHALGDVFLNPNYFSKEVRSIIAKQENNGTKSGKITAFLLNNLIKVLNVSSNYFATSLDYTGLGLPRAQVLSRFSDKEMTSKRANMLARMNKRGFVGLTFMLLGALTPQIFGGYNKKDDEEGVKEGEIQFGRWQVPHWLAHTPFAMPFQVGATIGNYLRNENKDKTGTEYVRKTLTGMLESNPFSYTFKAFDRALNSDKGWSEFWYNELIGQFLPYHNLVKEVGEKIDELKNGADIKRVGSDWGDYFKLDIGANSDVSTDIEYEAKKRIERALKERKPRHRTQEQIDRELKIQEAKRKILNSK